MVGWMGRWLNKTRLGTVMPIIRENFLSQTTHDVEIISMAEEGKYFINK